MNECCNNFFFYIGLIMIVTTWIQISTELYLLYDAIVNGEHTHTHTHTHTQ